MNRTTIFNTFAILVGVSIVGVVVIIIVRPDATATMIGFVGTTIAVLSSFAVTANSLVKVAEKQSQINEKVERVESQTNGRLTRMSNRNAQLVRELINNNIPIPGEMTEND